MGVRDHTFMRSSRWGERGGGSGKKMLKIQTEVDGYRGGGEGDSQKLNVQSYN